MFRVLKNGKVVFWTENKECVPDAEEIKKLKSAGYQIEYGKGAEKK